PLGTRRSVRRRRERPHQLIHPAHRVVGRGGAVEHDEAGPVGRPGAVGNDAAGRAVLPLPGLVAVLGCAEADHLDLHDAGLRAQSRTSTLVPTSRNLTSMVASALKPNPRAPGSITVPVLCALAIIGGGSGLLILNSCGPGSGSP